jgi:RNA polymerase sigma-70 factor (ECF subfamily)
MDDEITPPSTPGALDQLAASEYQSLRELTRRLRRRGSREPDPETESLVHEVYVRLKRTGNESWNDRTHFLAVAALQLRHVLVDLARAARAQKRGGHDARVTLDDEAHADPQSLVEVLAVDEALKALAQREPRQHRVAELRLFGGLSVEEIAQVLDVSPRTVREDWRQAKAWLTRQLRPASGSGA